MAADPTSTLNDRVRRALSRWRRRGEPKGVVVAVSGGGDSVAMLRALHAVAPGLGIPMAVAHLHHGARGEEADGDERFVVELAGRLGLPVELGRWRPGRAARFEAEARRARYDWLAGVAGRLGFGLVAVGHTSDDQAETVLHRIVRGTGPRGLAGIPTRRRLAEGIDLVRPLLGTSRREARAYLDALGQPWREDATNDDRSRTRARIRHEILPTLAELNPKVAEALVRLARSACEAVMLADDRVAELARSSRADAQPGTIAFRRDRLAALPAGARAEVVRLAWRRAGWPEGAMSAARWRRIAHLVRSDRGRHAIGAGVDLILSADLARLVPGAGAGTPPIPPPPAPLSIPGEVGWAGHRIAAAIDPTTDAPADERIDLDAVDPLDDGETGPHLLVGPALPGDRFAPLGMAGRSMPVADFLRGRRVPTADRGLVPVVRDRRGLIWVVGHRIADRVRRTGATRRLLGLRVVGGPPSPA